MSKKLDESVEAVETEDYGIDPKIMAEARERAIRKRALELAEKELDTDLGKVSEPDTAAPKVKRGPPSSVSKEPTVTFTLDLAEHSDRITIDGKIYLHGATYTLPQSVYNGVREAIYRGWEHQREIDGKDRNAYRKQANLILGPNAQGMLAKDILKASGQAA